MSFRNPTAILKISDNGNEGSCEKWTPSSLNFNVNSPNMVHVCGYKLPITGQNVAHKDLAQAKRLLIAFFWRGLFFDSSCL